MVVYGIHIQDCMSTGRGRRGAIHRPHLVDVCIVLETTMKSMMVMR